MGTWLPGDLCWATGSSQEAVASRDSVQSRFLFGESKALITKSRGTDHVPRVHFCLQLSDASFFRGNNSQGRLGRRSPGSGACVGRTGITGAVGEDLQALAAASVGGGGRPGIAQQVRGEVACAGPGCGRSSRRCPLAINPVPVGCSAISAKPPSSREASQARDGEPSPPGGGAYSPGRSFG